LAGAFDRLRNTAAVGVDGITKEDYGRDLQSNLHDLHERLRTKRYRHQPIRRVHIPKEKSGQTRPIGISATEDKVVQSALREVLEAIYGAPGKAWRFQWVKIPHRQGASHPTGNRALGLWR
jgi:RNA-directed DNA polymerase